MESRSRNIISNIGMACLLSAGVVAWARMMHPATFSTLAYPFLLLIGFFLLFVSQYKASA